MSAPGFALLADLTALAHAGFVLFVVFGQVLILLGWRLAWLWTCGFVFRSLHLAAIVVVAAQAWLGILCPLTVLEQRLRVLAGTSARDGSFVAYWVNRLLFYDAPWWVFTVLYTVFAALVLATWLLHPPRRRSRGSRPAVDGPHPL